MHRPVLRTAWTLTAVGAATAVGVLTQRPGFTVITFVGTLVVPRMLGIGGHRHGCFGHHRHGHDHRGRGAGLEARLADWHSRAHGEPAATTPGEGTAAPA